MTRPTGRPRDPHIGFRARYCHWCGDLLIPEGPGMRHPRCHDDNCTAGPLARFCSEPCRDAHRKLARKRAPR